MNEKSIAISLARKLKELRTAAGYSHEVLSKEIFARYGVKIGDDMLAQYEIDNEYHSKAKNGLPNMRMRVDTLYCLADLYGVSLDFLMGKELIPTGNPEKKAASKFTGLDPECIQRISDFSHLQNKELFRFVNELIMLPDFESLLYPLYDYYCAAIAEEIYWSLRRDAMNGQEWDEWAELSEENFAAINRVVEEKISSGKLTKQVEKCLRVEQELQGRPDTSLKDELMSYVDSFSLRDVYGYRASHELSLLLESLEYKAKKWDK